MNLAKHDAETDMDMDMTPMIDVVFLLIIFFMVITDLTQQDLEDLDLPMAAHAHPDTPDPEEFRPILNIPFTGEMIYKKKTYFAPETHTGTDKWSDLRTQLKVFADLMKAKDRKIGKVPAGSPPNQPLLIRADMTTEFKWVQLAMEQCAQPTIQIWMIDLAVSTPEENQ